MKRREQYCFAGCFFVEKEKKSKAAKLASISKFFCVMQAVWCYGRVGTPPSQVSGRTKKEVNYKAVLVGFVKRLITATSLVCCSAFASVTRKRRNQYSMHH